MASPRNAPQGVELGFDGKTLIHPNQIEPCNTAFSPSQAEVEQARKMIAAFDLPENKGKGVVSIDGRMVERCTRIWPDERWRSRKQLRDITSGRPCAFLRKKE